MITKPVAGVGLYSDCLAPSGHPFRIRVDSHHIASSGGVVNTSGIRRVSALRVGKYIIGVGWCKIAGAIGQAAGKACIALFKIAVDDQIDGLVYGSCLKRIGINWGRGFNGRVQYSRTEWIPVEVNRGTCDGTVELNGCRAGGYTSINIGAELY